MFLKTYVSDLFSSISTLSFYRTLPKRKTLKQSLAFYLLSFIFIGWLGAAQLSLHQLPSLVSQISNQLEAIPPHFPTDTTITWDNDRLTLSPPEILVLPYPLTDEAITSRLPATFALISPAAVSPDEVITQADLTSLLVITSTTAYISDTAGSWTAVALNTLPGFESPFTLTSQTIASYIPVWQGQLQEIVTSLQFLLFLLMPFILIIMTTIAVLLDSLLLYFMVRLFSPQTNYWQVLQLTLHLAVVATLVEQTALLLYGQLPFSLFSLSFWLLASLVLLSQQVPLRIR